MKMPAIDLTRLRRVLGTGEFQIVQGIVATRGQNKGCLRAAKPPVEYIKVLDADAYRGYRHEPRGITGHTAYVWRMVAFYTSPDHKHQCMPVMAECDLPGTVPEARELAKTLDALVDKVVDTIPKDQWHGVRRWGNAYGLIGEPQVAPDGAIIYR